MSLEELAKLALHSLVVHFNAELSPSGYVHVEGRKRLKEDTYPLFELRIDGPDIKTVSKDSWMFTFDVNVAIISEQDTKDLYNHTKLKSKCYTAFENNVHLKNYNDSSQMVDCFNRTSDIITIDFDLINDNLLGTTVESIYQVHLTDN